MQPDAPFPDIPDPGHPLKPVDPGDPDDDDEEEAPGKRLVVLEDMPQKAVDYREISFSAVNITFKICSTHKRDNMEKLKAVALLMLKKIQKD